jgi:ATP-dependent DNA ligase
VTAQYPRVVASVAALDTDVVLDGEIVALDEDGKPSFQALQHRTTTKHHIAFYAFDLLHESGRDVLGEPLEERQKRLARIVAGSSVLLSEPLPGTPEQIAGAVSKESSQNAETPATN